MNRNQRNRNRHTANVLRMHVGATCTCPRCGQQTFTGHYAPPRFGEPGVWVCSKSAKPRAEAT